MIRSTSTPTNDFYWEVHSGCLDQYRQAGFSTEWRTLPFLLLEWTSEGSWTLDLEGVRDISVAAGEVLCVPPGLLHRLRAHSRLRSSWAMIVCEDELGASLLNPEELPAALPREIGDLAQKELRPLLEEGRRLTDLSLPQRLVRRCAGLRVMQQLLAAYPRAFGGGRRDPRVETAIRYIRANFARAMGRNEIARVMGLSPSRCHSVFSASVGQAPVEYLLSVRMEVAQKLLLSTSLPVSEISWRCGFDLVSYFCRYFRRKVGQTPTEYRVSHMQRGKGSPIEGNVGF